MTDQELKDLVASLAVSQKETDKQIKETSKLQKETYKQMKATDKQLQATDKQLQATDKQLQETDRKLAKVGRLLGNIGKNQGDVAEEFFVNSIFPTMKVGGIQYEELYENMNKKTRKLGCEFDIVLINSKNVAIIETKYKAHPDDLEDLTGRQYSSFKKLYPQYNNYKHHLGLASFYISEDLKSKALSNNVMVLQRKGDIVETICP